MVVPCLKIGGCRQAGAAGHRSARNSPGGSVRRPRAVPTAVRGSVVRSRDAREASAGCRWAVNRARCGMSGVGESVQPRSTSTARRRSIHASAATSPAATCASSIGQDRPSSTSAPDPCGCAPVPPVRAASQACERTCSPTSDRHHHPHGCAAAKDEQAGAVRRRGDHQQPAGGWQHATGGGVRDRERGRGLHCRESGGQADPGPGHLAQDQHANMMPYWFPFTSSRATTPRRRVPSRC